jgi:hypothetical protein
MKTTKIAPAIDSEYFEKEKMKEFTLIDFSIIGFYKAKFYTSETEPEPIWRLLKHKLPHLFIAKNKIHVTIKEKVEVHTDLPDTWLEKHSDYKLLDYDHLSDKPIEV